MDPFVITWIILFAAGLVVEFRALARRKAGDTLSEQVWKLRTRLVARAILLPGWAWLTWHFFIEPPSLDIDAGVWIDDGIVIAVFLGVALFVDYKVEPSPKELQHEHAKV